MRHSDLQKATCTSGRSEKPNNNDERGRTLPAVPVLQNKIVKKIAAEGESLQGKFNLPTTLEQPGAISQFAPGKPILQKKENNTGLPDNLKEGVENLSGLAMDDVRVHHNSDRPAQLNALAYAQGTDIHVGPRQEKHLPHEAWHVVQQKQGRVQPTRQMKEVVAVNDDRGLENEADVMGGKATEGPFLAHRMTTKVPVASATVQREPQTRDGKEVMDDLTNPSWMPIGSKSTAGKEAITGAELQLLMKGAVESAWKTYAYHATKSANVASITSEGLDPRLGGTGAAAGSEAFKEHSRGHVHYTRKHGLAEEYKSHFEGHSPFGRKVDNPEAAEVLQIALHKDTVNGEEVDPDSKGYDQAYRTRSSIPGKFIRRMLPVPIPGPRKENVPLKPGENEKAWAEHVIRGQAEDSALLSNMPHYATNIMYDMMKKGLDVTTMLQLIKQGLRSMSAEAILEMSQENRKVNPRIYQNRMDATGMPLPFKF